MMLSAQIKDTDSSLVQPDQTCQRFSIAEIQLATNNFDETKVIGRGGFGKVYKCSTNIGLAIKVAVKRLHSMSIQGADEFEAEVKLLSKLRHGNLVSLIGYCNEEEEMVVVYEFMPNGTLEDHLRKRDSSLSWLQRLKICIGAARGLDYLHTGTSTQHGVIHRDVKTSNILLDAKFAAKISDFGLAKVGLIDQTQTHVSTAVKGTFGYMDPCYFYTGKLTRKSDVYAFGVVLFEVLSGRKAVDSTLDEEQWGLAVWAQDQIKEGKLNRIIDPRLNGQISKKCLKEFANIARHCLHTQPKRRPTMAEVVVKLEAILSQERESTNSVVYDEGFIYKLRSFFTGKSDSAIESKSNIFPLAKLTVDELDAARGSSIKKGFRNFTYDELRKAKLVDTNKFYYDGKLKRWVEEGADPPAEEAALPPPPTMPAFQNQNQNQNQNGGMPPLPTSNPFSARGRTDVFARYVDTFKQSEMIKTYGSLNQSQHPPHALVAFGFDLFGFGSQLIQKTVGLVLKPRGDTQAKLVNTNKYYYDEKLKGWVEEGADPPADEAALPPPPTMAAFQNQNQNGGMPALSTSNQFSARGRTGVFARYVDTFNQGGGNPTNLFHSPPPALTIKQTPTFFLPTSSHNTQQESSLESFSSESKSFQSPSPTMARQKFASMDDVTQANHQISSTTSPRTASWGSFSQPGMNMMHSSSSMNMMDDQLQDVDL